MRTGLNLGLIFVIRDVLISLVGGEGVLLALASSLLLCVALVLLYHYVAFYLVTIREGFSFLDAVCVAVMAMFFAGMIFALYSYFYMTEIEPQALGNIVGQMTQILGERMSVEELRIVEEQVRGLTPARVAPYMCVSFAVMGVGLGILDAITLRITYKRMEETYKKVKEWADNEMKKLDDLDE